MSATATVQRPPTEAEIREHALRAFAESDGSSETVGPDNARRGAIAWEDAWSEAGAVVESLWTGYDLRPSEEARLSQLMGEAVAQIRDEARPRLIEALVRAAVTFAQDYPDAPLAPRT